MKRIRRNWQISPRDLPDPRLIKDEPLLQDLENNAVYRTFVFRQNYVPFTFAHPHIMGWIYMLLFIFPIWQFGPVALPAVPIGLLLIRSFNRRFNKSNPLPLLGLTRQHIRDIIGGGHTARDVTIALWAYQLLTPFGFAMTKLFPKLLALLLLFSPLIVKDFYLILVIPSAWWAGKTTASNSQRPWSALTMAHATLLKCQDAREAGGSPAFVGCRNAVMLLLYFMLSGVAAGFLYAYKPTIRAYGGTFFAEFLVPEFILIAVILAGAAWGYFRGRLLAIRDAEFDYTLNAMDSSVTKLIEECKEDDEV